MGRFSFTLMHAGDRCRLQGSGSVVDRELYELLLDF